MLALNSRERSLNSCDEVCQQRWRRGRAYGFQLPITHHAAAAATSSITV